MGRGGVTPPAPVPSLLRRPRALQRVGQDRNHLLLLRLREAEDLPQRDADVRDVGLDIRLLLLRLGQTLAVTQEDSETAAALLQGETQLLMISGYDATASLLSEVNGTQTDAMCTNRIIGPVGSAPFDCCRP